MTVKTRLQGDALTLGYDKKIVAENLTVAIPDGELTVIIGPNACGKSTLLRTLSRLVSPLKGQVLLDGNAIAHYATKEVARRLGLLPQSSNAPAGISVSELVARGRYPHQSLFGRWRQDDETAVQQAMQATGVADLAQQQVDIPPCLRACVGQQLLHHVGRHFLHQVRRIIRHQAVDDIGRLFI